MGAENIPVQMWLSGIRLLVFAVVLASTGRLEASEALPEHGQNATDDEAEVAIDPMTIATAVSTATSFLQNGEKLISSAGSIFDKLKGAKTDIGGILQLLSPSASAFEKILGFFLPGVSAFLL